MFEVLITIGLVYVGCLLAWVNHHGRRFSREIDKPWREAIARQDWRPCTAFKKAADWYLNDFKFSLAHLNPLHWIRTWNRKYV